MFDRLSAYAPQALAVLRIVTALLFILHGTQKIIGFPASDQLDTKVTTRGYRQVAQINRLPGSLGERLIEHFGSLQALFAASRAELQAVEGVGEQRARAIRDGLVRVAESAYADPLL